MAGIGFALRKIAREDNFLGIIRAQIYSALISTGPWLFSVLALSMIIFFCLPLLGFEALEQFRIVVIYNFCFSFVLCGPLFLIITRYLADALHKKDLSLVPDLLLGGLAVLFTIDILAIYWVFFRKGFTIWGDDAFFISQAVLNFFLISAVWFAHIFLSSIDDYLSILLIFFFGTMLSIACAYYAAISSITVLAGFNLGLAFILFCFFGKIFSVYEGKLQRPFAFMRYFIQYWDLALGGLLLNLVVWADKWMMWTAPEARSPLPGFVHFPNYDSAMFLAYLTVVPIMGCFTFSMETSFYEKYLSYYAAILGGKPLDEIEKERKELIKSTYHQLYLLQFAGALIACSAILLSSKIFQYFSINYLQISIFRLGVLGAFFQIFFLIHTIMLYYFDARRKALFFLCLYLILNLSLTALFLHLGYAYYGYGFFLSSLLSYVIISFATFRHLDELIFHSFISNNSAID